MFGRGVKPEDSCRGPMPPSLHADSPLGPASPLHDSAPDTHTRPILHTHTSYPPLPPSLRFASQATVAPSIVDDFGYLVCQEELKNAAEQLALQTGATAADVWPRQEPQPFEGRASRSAKYVKLEEGKLKRMPMEESIPPKPVEAPPQPTGPERLRRPSPGAWLRCHWLLTEAKQRARFQMLRHRFLIADGIPSGGKGAREILPGDFQFSNYQQECATSFMEHTLHLGTSTWLISLLVMVSSRLRVPIKPP